MSHPDRPVTEEEIVARAGRLRLGDSFPLVDDLLARLEELRERHPKLLTVRRIGTSRLGEPIPLYTLDGVDRAASTGLIVGGVHPNEPIGSLTILQLLDDLIADEDLRRRLGTRWHIIPCADPDAMRLNEGWFSDPSDDETYFRAFHRPPGHEQVEWTFPVDYKEKYFDAMLPETHALQRAIDQVRPDFYVPLHNSETGGAYYYISPELADMVPLLLRLPAALGIPLHRGEPESALSRTLAPAVYATGTFERTYEWRVQHGLDPAPPGSAGQSSTSYASRYGTSTLIAELPIWRTFGADDTSPSGRDYDALLRGAGEELEATGAFLTMLMERVRPRLRIDSPHLRSAEAFVPAMAQTGRAMIVRAGLEENRRPATVAERPMSVTWMYRLRYGGALLRAMRAEAEAGSADVEVRRAIDELEEVFSGWLATRLREESPEALALASVVGVQYGAILGLAARGAGAGDAAVSALVEGVR